MSEASCRILTVSTSLDTSLDLVKRIQQLSSAASIETKASTTGETETHVPWTIENKYYKADVHFLARPIKGLAPYHFQGIPAVIFVWGRGEAYKHHIHRLSKDVAGAEPEVSLADKEDEEDASEETSIIDEFLSSHGFEFIDASDVAPEEEEDAIPSLPRVLDALSTIMWPSMQTSVATSKKSSRPNQRGAAFLEWAQSSFDTTELSPDEADFTVPALAPLRTPDKVHTEMEELARWLEDGGKEDPWKTSDMSFSPTDLETEGWGDHVSPADDKTVVSGFDDDFSVFVSAPPAEAKHASEDQSLPDEPSFDEVPFDVSFGSDRLGPADGDIMYHSLGSHSDLGDTSQDVPYDSLDDNDIDTDGDEDMPSKSEIRESAQRIFGSQTAEAESEADAEDFDLAPFDIGQVMSALQGMKAEIAGWMMRRKEGRLRRG
ncbi:hypothetical protein CPB85DRAFT_1430188 [Mucidula mucida]|nr:hypothetical protein CPB85DRAFT_1430188 [Mucidula mucida]